MTVQKKIFEDYFIRLDLEELRLLRGCSFLGRG
jgi:hypothetical protein